MENSVVSVDSCSHLIFEAPANSCVRATSDRENFLWPRCRNWPHTKARSNMGTTTVNIAFQESLLREIDRVAESESRSRSELLREAARAYIERKQRWADLFAAGRQVAEDRALNPEDVAKEIRAHRKAKAARR